MKRILLVALGSMSALLLVWIATRSGSDLDSLNSDTLTLRGEESGSVSIAAEHEAGEQRQSAGGNGASTERKAVLLGGLDLEHAAWIEGHVVLPRGTPADAQSSVVATRTALNAGALGSAEEQGETPPVLLSRAPVQNDASFRIPIPADGGAVHLSIHGRYLYSLRSTRIEAQSTAPVELTAKLGAWVLGEVVTPRELRASAELDGMEARLVIDPKDSTNMFDGSAWEVRTVPAGGGRFEFTAVATQDPLRVFAYSETLAAATSDRLDLEPGQKLELRLTTDLGGVLRGRVLDAGGEALPEVEVFVLDDANFMAGRPGRRVREALTDGLGRFELHGVLAGALSLRAHLPDHLDVSERVDLKRGETIEGLELVLTRGRSIAGRVLGPDGKGLGGARLTALFDLGVIGGMQGIHAIRGNFQETRSASDGAFVLSGLGRGPFTVSASWLPAGEEADTLEEHDRLRRAYRARIDRVQPGEQELELELSAPLAAAGRVFSSDGNPATNFLVLATKSAQSLVVGFGAEAVQRQFQSVDGSFELWGLRTGSWSVVVSAPGHAPSEPQTADVRADGELDPLQFFLTPEATVSGSVLLPDGTPASGAQVSSLSSAFERMSRVFHSVEEDRSTSGETGSFQLAGLQAGRLSLVARLEGYADSVPVELELTPATPLEDVTLQLRKGASVRGEVFGADGLPAIGDAVIAQIPGSLDMLQTSSDQSGRFQFEDMLAGTWQIIAMPNEDHMAGLLNEEGGVGRMLAGMRVKIVELKEGEQVQIQLGEALPDPVRVSGQITLDGEPVPGTVVSFIAEAGQGGSVRLESADADGHYELDLPSGGAYLMLVQRMGEVMAETSLEFRVIIPDRETHELDIQIPLGRISGTVTGPDNEPLAGARLSLVGAGQRDQTFWGGQFTETITDSGGRYVVDWLDAGAFRVTAGGLRFGGLFGEPSAWGRGEARRVDVEEGEHVEGIDFRLSLGGAVSGVVRSALGVPVPDAAVFVYDHQGQLVERLSFTRSDAGGEFTVSALAPGEYSLLARAGLEACVPSERVAIEEEKISRLDLHVEPSTVLEVEVRGPDNKPVPASVHVFDSEGRELSSMITFDQLLQSLQSGSAEVLRRIGPLAPGRYSVSASVPGVGGATKKLTLRGQATKRVVLRLK